MKLELSLREARELRVHLVEWLHDAEVDADPVDIRELQAVVRRLERLLKPWE